MNKDKLIRIMKNSDAMLVVTDRGIHIEGTVPTLLALYAILTENMLKIKPINKEILDEAYNSAFNKAVGKELEKTVNDFLKKLEKLLGEVNNE